LEPLTRASAIIVDENDVGTFIDKAGNLKSVITNDVIAINRKFKTPISFQFNGFMVQCLNEFPKIKDKSDSFYRRQLFIPMTKCFTGAERKYIKNEYLHRQDVLEYILKRVLEMNYYSLSEPNSCTKALIEYKEFNDPVRQFWDELRTEFVWDLLPFTFLYDLYKSWFKLNSPSGTVLGKTTFVNDLLQIIKGDKMWYCLSKDYQTKTSSTNIGDSEPLIIEYGLTDWMSKSYKGNNPVRLAEFDTPKVNYRGILRYNPNQSPNNDNDEEEDA
jgi:putative DNA primase/helicase